MDNTQASQETTAVLGNFSFTLPAPNGAQLSISGYLYAGESKESLDDRMDVCRESLARQQKLLEVPVLEAHLEQLEKARVDLSRAYADLLDRSNKTPKSLPSQEQANLKNYPLQIKNIEEQLEKAHAKIAAARAGV
ncbi:hypothetical protein Q8F57_027170 [Paraburkholderia terrae]|uniref:hypothetical protein n=1 Tax=Paraburkholderia terrae TaxID=311230 RepID=UPI00296AB3E3|nr:hypothetical protein [Paraburkholderia terrae]MDW3660299.1 hypothetical protein [Paraburkholderia terrae]